MDINRKDIFWNYAATFLKIASAIILLPLILKIMPSEMVGVWTVFMSITAFSSLLNFGFNGSFTRNVTYIFSGVNNLKVKGHETVSEVNQPIDYGLLKGVIIAMQWVYLRMAILLFLILSTLGTWYMYSILQNYKGVTQEVYIAWIILCLINTYNLYTLYYGSLLQGKGLVKKSKQIVIVGHLVYLGIASVFILSGFGLIAIVSAQASSVVIVRWLSYRFFFTIEIKQKLKEAIERNKIEILKAIYPNALKIGISTLGKFMIQTSPIIIGPLYLSLEEIATYGITMQFINVIGTLAGIYTLTFGPKISQLRVKQNNNSIKEYYLKGQLVLFVTYIVGGLGLLLFGKWGINLIGSKTQLMPLFLITLALFLNFEQSNRSIAAGILLTKNEVPFYKAYFISGIVIVIGLFACLTFLEMGLLTLLLVPLVVDIAYQAWKWPLEVKKELQIERKDFYSAINSFRKFKL
jgi:O-antigen/teichoic acid export membrane protein